MTSDQSSSEKTLRRWFNLIKVEICSCGYFAKYFGGEAIVSVKTLFIHIVFKQKIFVLPTIGGDRTLSPPPKCPPLRSAWMHPKCGSIGLVVSASKQFQFHMLLKFYCKQCKITKLNTNKHAELINTRQILQKKP